MKRSMPLLGLAVGVAGLVTSCATQAGQAGTGAMRPDVARQADDRGTVLEVRPTEPAENTLAADVVDKVRAVPGVSNVELYLFGNAADGTVVVGIEPLEATLRTAAGQALRAEVVGGRAWVRDDESQPSAYVGRAYAGTHKTMLNLDIQQMITPTHSPPVDLGGGNAVNVRAVVETGSPEGNAQAYVPLTFAQQMFGQPGRVSSLYVWVGSPDQREAVAGTIRAAVGDAAEVVVVR